MRKRGSPIIIISIIIGLLIVLAVIQANRLPPELRSGDEQDVTTHGHDASPGVTNPPGPSKSPEELMKDIEQADKTQKAPPAPRKIPVEDRDDEGSSHWWSDEVSPSEH
jgi:hypothetical protein